MGNRTLKEIEKDALRECKEYLKTLGIKENDITKYIKYFGVDAKWAVERFETPELLEEFYNHFGEDSREKINEVKDKMDTYGNYKIKEIYETGREISIMAGKP